MTPEEKFNQEVWWVLQEIKKEGLATRKDCYVCFEFQSPQSDNNKFIPPREDQRRAIKLLENEGAIRIEKNKYSSPVSEYVHITDLLAAKTNNIKPIGYFLEILQPKFNEIYEKFRKLNEKYQPQHAQIEKIFTNEVIPEHTAEIEKQMQKTQKWQEERTERERLHKEQMKQDRILRTPVDKYTHALDLIIERAEFAGNGNSFSIEFYDFNFEQMIGSKMLEKFLTEMQKDGCFENYTRTNYTGGTRFGFIKPSVKKLKEFKEKRRKEEIKTSKLNKEILETEQLLDKMESDIKAKAKKLEKFEVKVKDRYIWINDYLLSKPHAVGSNFEFFEYIRSKSANTKIERNSLPDFGGICLKKDIKNKSFIKILNELGFKGEILKAFFPKRGKNMLIYRGDKITKKDLEKSGIKIPVFIKELELAHLRNSPE